MPAPGAGFRVSSDGGGSGWVFRAFGDERLRAAEVGQRSFVERRVGEQGKRSRCQRAGDAAGGATRTRLGGLHSAFIKRGRFGAVLRDRRRVGRTVVPGRHRWRLHRHAAHHRRGNTALQRQRNHEQDGYQESAETGHHLHTIAAGAQVVAPALASIDRTQPRRGLEQTGSGTRLAESRADTRAEQAAGTVNA